MHAFSIFVVCFYLFFHFVSLLKQSIRVYIVQYTQTPDWPFRLLFRRSFISYPILSKWERVKKWEQMWDTENESWNFVLSVNDFSEGTSRKTYPCMDRFVSFFSALFKMYISKHMYICIYICLYDENATNKKSGKNPRQARLKSEKAHFKESNSVHWCLSLTKTILLLIYLINL